jgi:GNAT superfamily N-acetyltransferase
MRIQALRADAADEVYDVVRASTEAETPDIPFDSREAWRGKLTRPWPGRLLELHVARDDDGEAIGLLLTALPQLESLDTANLELHVHPAHRRRGVGRALFEVAKRTGRKHLVSAAVDDSPFAEAMGAKPALTELRSRLELTETLPALTPVAAGYRLISWTDRVADEYVHDLAALESRLFADSPMGELEWEPEKVDAARIREAEASIRARGRIGVHTGAIHEASGRLIAWTHITCRTDVPWHGWQQITLVDPGHRGHRLGLAIKTANLPYARSAAPELRAVDTLNAEANAPMLAVNTALGFRPVNRLVMWQLTL